MGCNWVRQRKPDCMGYPNRVLRGRALDITPRLSVTAMKLFKVQSVVTAMSKPRCCLREAVDAAASGRRSCSPHVHSQATLTGAVQGGLVLSATSQNQQHLRREEQTVRQPLASPPRSTQPLCAPVPVSSPKLLDNSALPALRVTTIHISCAPHCE
jgi:hypothetical protein